MKLLSINEENIDNTIKDLEKLQELTKYLDFPPMVETNEKLKVIEPIEMEFAEKSNQYLTQDEKFKNVLEVYNQSIRDINLHFMYLESLVTQLENKK